MIPVATTSLNRLATQGQDLPSVIPWSCPVPYFGNVTEARIATVGINPSGREFTDNTGRELDGHVRRFPTLASLGLPEWRQATSLDVNRILRACTTYFASNPYDRWFRVLDRAIARTGSSYYCNQSPAAHLDLVPYATNPTWAGLPRAEQRALLDAGADLLGQVLRDSSIGLVVLNGRSVIREFERISGHGLAETHMPRWDLPRDQGDPVPGLAYTGSLSTIGQIELDRTVTVVGFNHNLQSSFGVTREAINSISEWIGART